MRYSTSRNVYEQYTKTSDGTVYIEKCEENWETCHLIATNIFRKTERDWKMVYLARTEDSQMASITWSFDFSQNNLKIKEIFLKFESKTYENGIVDLNIINENGKF